MGTDISIKVNIGDRHYPLRIEVGEEEKVRKAAKIINEKVGFYLSNFSVKDKQDALAMAALEFATDSMSAKTKVTELEGFAESKLKLLESLLDQSL
jgi:cell division protein ZapA (FtsZ GTPase activity inhibitor)